MEKKKWYQSTNFWIAVAMIFAGLFIGFPKEAAVEVVMQMTGVLAAVATIREYLKTAEKPSIKNLFNLEGDANIFNYLAAIFAAIFVTISPDVLNSIGEYLEEITGAILARNWAALFSPVIALATIVIKIIRGDKDPVTVGFEDPQGDFEEK